MTNRGQPRRSAPPSALRPFLVHGCAESREVHSWQCPAGGAGTRFAWSRIAKAPSAALRGVHFGPFRARLHGIARSVPRKGPLSPRPAAFPQVALRSLASSTGFGSALRPFSRTAARNRAKCTGGADVPVDESVPANSMPAIKRPGSFHMFISVSRENYSPVRSAEAVS